MDDRIISLKSLLSLKYPIDEITDALTKFDWDSDELVILEIRHVRQILERYLSGDLSETTVEAWANAIECRDDIGLAKRNESLLEELIHELANPALTQELSNEFAESLIHRMEL